MADRKFWTDERIEVLKKLYAEKKTYSEIAAVLGTKRSTIAGKIHGLKLSKSAQEGRKKALATGTKSQTRQRPGRPRQSATLPTFDNPPKPKPDQPRRRAYKADKPVSRKHRVRLPKELQSDEAFQERIDSLVKPKNDALDIPSDRHCKYIHGDVRFGKNAKWCRKPVHNGSSWCASHYKLIYPNPGK